MARCIYNFQFLQAGFRTCYYISYSVKYCTFNSFKPDSKQRLAEGQVLKTIAFNSFKPDSQEQAIDVQLILQAFFQFLQAGFLSHKLIILCVSSFAFNSFKPDSYGIDAYIIPRGINFQFLQAGFLHIRIKNLHQAMELSIPSSRIPTSCRCRQLFFHLWLSIPSSRIPSQNVDDIDDDIFDLSIPSSRIQRL